MCTNAGESPDRRERRRAVMSPFQLVLTLAVLALPFTADVATAQNSAPKPGASDPMPAPIGPTSPSPLQPGDAFGEQVTLPERTIVYLKGHSKWDNAFDTLVDAFKSLHEYLDKQDIKPTGPSFTIYTQTDDTGFSFQAALPIAQAPKDPPKGDIAVGPGPSGKASNLSIAARTTPWIRPTRRSRTISTTSSWKRKTCSSRSTPPIR